MTDKDAKPVTPILTGVPTGFSDTTTLAVTVSGTALAAYRFKVGASAGTDCSVESGYGVETPVATTISPSIASLADGEVRICVVGKSTGGTWIAPSAATTATWTKLTAPSEPVLTNEPAALSNTKILNIGVGGLGVTHYMHKVGVATSINCSDTTGYSAETAISQNITDDLTAVADGAMRLCVRAKNAIGLWQTFANSKVVDWIKETVGPTPVLQFVPTGENDTTTLGV